MRLSLTGVVATAGAAAALIVVATLALAARGAQPTPAATVPVPVAADTTAVVQACPSVASFLDVMTSYERQARWGLAASTAQTALHTPDLCDADRTSLGQKAVTLGREALFEQPPAPEDVPGQRRVATAYADLKVLATQYQQPQPAPLAIAQSAYDYRLFLLATVAYADAFANGDSSAQDREVVRADYSAQYNLGLIWSRRTDGLQRQEGLARLATACQIDERQQLNSREACNQLLTLVGPRTRWPTAIGDPLI